MQYRYNTDSFNQGGHMRIGSVLRFLFSASFIYTFALCAMVATSVKDASAAETAVTTAGGSRFDISVGTLLLRREGTHNYSILTEDGVTALDSNALNLDDYEPGLDVRAAYKNKNGLEANFRYFGLNSWSENTTTEFLGGSTSSSYSSKLDSAEINIGWWPTSYIGVFVGPRYLKLNELLDININNNMLAFSSYADNELWGGQVGVTVDLLKTRRGCVGSIWGKAGYYDNAISTRGDIQVFSSPLFHARGNSHTGTFAGEAGLDYKIVIVPHVALTTGYEMLWIEKATLATAGNATHIKDTDSVLYHGAKVALTIDW